jgi:hypothetical protein
VKSKKRGEQIDDKMRHARMGSSLHSNAYHDANGEAAALGLGEMRTDATNIFELDENGRRGVGELPNEEAHVVDFGPDALPEV